MNSDGLCFERKGGYVVVGDDRCYGFCDGIHEAERLVESIEVNLNDFGMGEPPNVLFVYKVTMVCPMFLSVEEEEE